MIKTLKPLSDDALINNDTVRSYLIQLDSDLMRGVNMLVILRVISDAGDQGAYGYNINQRIVEKTRNSFEFEEATLYSILKKLEKDQLVTTNMIQKRKYYYMTAFGNVVLDYGLGFLASINEAVLDIDKKEYGKLHDYIYCPNCSNRIHLKKMIAQGKLGESGKSRELKELINEETPLVKFCCICGYYIGNLIEIYLKEKNIAK